MRLLVVVATGAMLLGDLAWAADSDVRRAGEWQVTIMGANGKPNPPRNYCYAARSVADITRSIGDCSRNNITKVGATTTINASCTKAGHQISLNMVLTSMGETAYRARVHATYSPPIGTMSRMDMVAESKWLGPCPAGVAPVH
ncbi:MAG TPA: DUF3617 family protein [Caulobacteraceae bacterium]